MSQTYPVGQLARAGEKIDLRVDDDGNWLAMVAGRELKQQTRAKLVSDIDRILRLEKKAVHIPVTVMEIKNNGYLRLKHGVVTGIHAGTGNLTVSWDDGGAGQEDPAMMADMRAKQLELLKKKRQAALIIGAQ